MFLKLICALILIESGGDPTVIGDGGKAVGLLQIHPIRVRECNRIAGHERWTLEDRKDPVKSARMCALFLSYQKSKHPEYDLVRLGGTWHSITLDNSEYEEKICQTLSTQYNLLPVLDVITPRRREQ